MRPRVFVTRQLPQPALVRLGLALTRGLLLDLVATNDDEGVDAAAAEFVRLLDARQRGSRA